MSYYWRMITDIPEFKAIMSCGDAKLPNPLGHRVYFTDRGIIATDGKVAGWIPRDDMPFNGCYSFQMFSIPPGTKHIVFIDGALHIGPMVLEPESVVDEMPTFCSTVIERMERRDGRVNEVMVDNMLAQRVCKHIKEPMIIELYDTHAMFKTPTARFLVMSIRL